VNGLDCIVDRQDIRIETVSGVGCGMGYVGQILS
jgi:hypothetical protein